LCRVVLIQIFLLLSNLQSLVIGLCTGQKQVICSKTLSSREDHLPRKQLHICIFRHFFPKYFGPSKCSLWVCCGKRLPIITALFIFSWTGCNPRASKHGYLLPASALENNLTYYQTRKVIQSGPFCLFPVSNMLSHCIKERSRMWMKFCIMILHI